MLDRSEFDLHLGFSTLGMFVEYLENQINFIPCLEIMFSQLLVDLIDL